MDGEETRTEAETVKLTTPAHTGTRAHTGTHGHTGTHAHAHIQQAEEESYPLACL